MAKRFAFHFIVFVMIFSCNGNAEKEDTRQFLVGKNFVGNVTDSTEVKDLKFIFKNDSISSYKEDDSFVGGINPIGIYSKSGTPLLHIFPNESHDSTSTINYIHIKNSIYKTALDISVRSYFKDIKATYPISEIKNEMNYIEVYVDSLKSIFAFRKSGSLKDFDFGTEIKQNQIPDSTSIDYYIKYF